MRVRTLVSKLKASKQEKERRMVKMVKNEKGFALPLMIAITFIAAYLLLMLAIQLEVKVASYDRTRTYMVMNLLEREGLEKLNHYLSATDIDSDFYTTWILRNNARITVNATKTEDFFAFHYQIVYNGYIRLQKILFSRENGFIFLD